MKELYTNASEKIHDEIRKVADRGGTVTLYLKGRNPWQAKLGGIDNDNRVHVEKPAGFVKAAQAVYNILYPFSSVQGGTAMHGFDTVIVDDSAKEILFRFPAEIFELFQRKHQRVENIGNSRARYVRADTTVTVNGLLRDISMEGACILVDNLASYRKGDKIGPLLLVLCFNASTEEVAVRVEDADIMRVVQRGKQIQEIAVHFLPTDKEREKIRKFIETRSLEDSLGEDLPDF